MTALCRLAPLLAIAGLLASCASGPSPSAAPPVVVCDQGQWGDGVVPLRCEDAIAAALQALPANHLPIGRIEFRWGGYCPPSERCLLLPYSDRGIVLFTFAGRDPDAYLEVADAEGRVRVVSPLIPIAGS